MKTIYFLITAIFLLLAGQIEIKAQCPPPQSNTGGTSGCGAGTYTLLAVTSYSNVTHRWYTTPTGGTPLSGVVTVYTGGFPSITQYTAYFSATTTFYVSTYNQSANCESARVPVTFTLTTPAAPSVNISSSPNFTGGDSNGPILSICIGTSVTFTANPTNGGSAPAYQWYSNGSTISGQTGATYTSTALSDGQSISVKMTSNASCISPSTATSFNVRMTITPNVGTPGAITVASGSSEPTNRLIIGTPTTSYITSASNSTGYNWSIDNAAAGSINPTTGVMSWTDWFSGTVNIKVTANGCNGPSAQVTRSVTIVPITALPAVGVIEGSSSVNLSGAATYSIPLDVPPGVNGLNPKIALIYSSMGGSGIAGYGWQISGISAITRTSQTFYNDGQANGVNLDGYDRFALDGQRLVTTSGTYGTDGSQYRTENDIFTRVTAIGASGSGPAKFRTETKSGNIFEYGNTADAVQRLTGFNEAASWYVNSVSDLFGNKINYTYLNQNGLVYPSIITYGPNRIAFTYKARTDPTNSYFKGVKLVQNLLLDKVEVSYNNTVLKTYQLNYNYLSNNYSGQSTLSEVIESGTGGNSLNSTVFSYQQPENLDFPSPTLYSSSNISANSILYSGDFNGDGKADIFALSKSDNKTWKYYINNGDGTFVYSDGGTFLNPVDNVVVTDLNGDGKDDLVMVVFDWTMAGYNALISNGQTFTSAGLFSYTYCDARPYYNQPDYAADFDGNGKNEFLVKGSYGGTNSWKIYSKNNNPSLDLMYSGSISSWGDKSYTGDFNGDGKADIWVFDANGVKIYTVNGNSLTTLYSSSTITSNHKFQLGDFNGDGKTDIFVYGTSSSDSDWQIWLSTGNGFEIKYVPQKKSNLKDDKVYACDFNGDGRTDIMALSKNASGYPCQYYFIANLNGDNFFSEYKEFALLNKDYDYTLGDYDGDGKTDVITASGTTGYLLSKTTGTTDILMRSISNGLGNVTGINYKKLTDGSIYDKGSGGDVFPVSTYQGPLPVVSSVAIDNGISGANTVSYTYQGLKVHRQGKGFLGFSKIATTDVTSGIVTETQLGYDPTYYYPQVNTVTQKLSQSGTTIGTTTNSWTQLVLDAATKRIYPYVQSSTQTNALTGHSSTVTTSSVDGYCNPTQVVKSYNNGVTETTVSNYTNTDNSTDWKLGRVDNSTITSAKSGETPVSHTIRFTYSTDGILIKPDLIYFNEGTQWEYYKNNDYDSKGNLIQVYTSGASIGASQVNYTYDTDGIRLLTSTDALGHVKTNTYDSYGRLYTETDYLNNTNTYQYDAFARQTSVSNSNGSQSGTAYVWTGTNKPTLAVYGITQTGNDGSLSTAWYDKLQRTIRMEKKGFGGQMVLVDSEYNSKGQTYRVSDPYFAGGSVVWSEIFAYDSYGRSTGVTRNTGRNTTISYATNRVTETTAGKTRWKESDSQGLVTTAHDDGGDISYAYFPDGKAKTITAPGGVVTSMQYADAARNQTQLVDPSAGTINYTYDALGRLKTQTDARGRLTTNTYLPDGRTDNVVNPEGTTTYSYNDNKQLTGISNSTTSVSRAFGYDTKGRATSVGETIAGTPFTTSFTYDTYGRLSTRTHPSGIVETLGYNSSGYMATISAGGSTQYTITGMNARQQLTGSTYGSNLTATYGFDTYGYPTSTTTGSVQDYRYSFDPVNGNLNSRQNYLRNKSESFTYDNLDRLTGVTGPQNLTMTYNANGNISTKSDIGSTAFGYGNNAGPYALTGVTSSTGVIPAVSQTIGYTSFESVATIGEGDYNAAIIYNCNNQRAKMDVTQSGNNILTRWYSGSSYMKETARGTTKEYTYLGGDAYSAPVVAVTQSGTTTYYYLLRDYLGNITHVYNSSNSTTQEYNFDAWGRRRNPTDWSYDLTSQPELFAGRGFTSHEHLPWFNLINMNGRLYDPAVGRFISPDNFVQAPGNSQSYNRYSYCLNNPLKYTDISGNSWWSHFWGWAGENAGSIITTVYLVAAVATCFVNPVLGGAMIGGYIGGVSSNGGQLNAGAWNWNDPATYCGIFVGAAMGAAGGYWAVHPDAFTLNIGLSSKYAQAFVSVCEVTAGTGKGTDWQFNFNWSTAAGGSGSINLNGSQPPTAKQVTENAIADARAKGRNGSDLDPSTIGHNLLWLSYPGGNNPRTYSGDYTYSYVPENAAEYPAIGHDRRYDKLGISGLNGLLTDQRACGADMRYVLENMAITYSPTSYYSLTERVDALILGTGLGLMSLPKTLLQLAKPNGALEMLGWYNYCNKGITNIPSN